MTRAEAIEKLKSVEPVLRDNNISLWFDVEDVIDLLEREQEDDDRLDALRFATMEFDKKYPKFVEGVRKAWNESNRIPKEKK